MNWDVELRSAQDVIKRKDAEKKREEEDRINKLKGDQVGNFVWLMRKLGVEVPADLEAPEWTSPDGFTFSVGHDPDFHHNLFEQSKRPDKNNRPVDWTRVALHIMYKPANAEHYPSLLGFDDVQTMYINTPTGGDWIEIKAKVANIMDSLKNNFNRWLERTSREQAVELDEKDDDLAKSIKILANLFDEYWHGDHY